MSSSWSENPKLSDFFVWSGSGVTPHRTWPIAPDVQSLERRWNTLASENDADKKEFLFQSDRDRNTQKIVALDMGQHTTRRTSIENDKSAVVVPIRYAYRSLDRQWLIPDNRLLSMQRPKLWDQYSTNQIYITALERSQISNGPAFSITALIPDLDHFKGSFGGRVYPLWANATASISNINSALLNVLTEAFGTAVSPEDMMAYVSAVLAHPAFTARFAKDLKQPGLRVPLTADATLFAEAVSIGREVIWLHCYGERFADDSAGRPFGPPRLPKNIAPTIPKGGAIPPAPEPLPDDMHYDAANQRLHIGKGYIDHVSPDIWAYEISGKNVLKQWFSYRKRDRSRPQIGEKRPPSPLSLIQPDGWLAEYTTDLLDLLNVLGRVIALHDRQADLLTRICDGPLIALEDLQEAGIVAKPENAETEDET